MAGLRLTRGGESRLGGAPYQELPGYADAVDAVAAKLLEEDTDGLLANDQELARERAKLILNSQLDAHRNASAERQAQVAEDYGRRQDDRVQARGVDPETMPYGASASDVRLANRPFADASAQLGMEQDAADRVVRGLREGTPTFEAQGDLDFLRERGDMNPLAGPGRTDMAMRGAIRERRGQYYEMPDGTRIPVGREPTAAEIRAEREWQDWTNETPGTERQALYNPAGYEQFREGVRQDIQDSARADMATYGTGTDEQLLNSAESGNRMAAQQYRNRQARRDSEERVRNAQRGRFYQDKLMVDAGVSAQRPGPGATVEELERAAFRNRYARRQAELESRKQARIEQAQLAGGQPTGGPFGTRATTTAINQLGPGWREIALLDRLTNGRVGGPTPLYVEAANASSAAQMAQQAMVAFLRNNPGATPEQAAAAAQQVRNLNPAMAGGTDIASGRLDTPEAQAEFGRLAASLDTTRGGMSHEDEMAMASALQRPPYNLDQPTAEELAYRYAEKRRWFSRDRGAPKPEDTGLPPPGSLAPPF